jgi:hypothetical protein
MAIRVTNAVTKYGRYYRQGELIENPTSVENSLRRLYKWDLVEDSVPGLSGLKKAELLQLCQEAGLEVSATMTKTELKEMLEQ